MRLWYDEWSLPPRLPSDDSDLVSRLLADEHLRAMVEISYGYKWPLPEEFDNALAAVDAILAEIDSSVH